jgi:hypothetical protein
MVKPDLRIVALAVKTEETHVAVACSGSVLLRVVSQSADWQWLKGVFYTSTNTAALALLFY